MLPTPPRPKSRTRLGSLAVGLPKQFPDLAGLPIGNIKLPLRTASEVLDTLARGDITSIGALEWMMFLLDKKWWQSRRTIDTEVDWIARAAERHGHLRELTVSCVALGTLGAYHCDKALVDRARSGRLCNNSQRARLLAELLSNDAKSVASRCWQEVVSPTELVQQADFPRPDEKLLARIRRECFGRKPTSSRQDFYLHLLAHLSPKDIESAVLLGWEPKDSDQVPRVRRWLLDYFQQHGEDDLSRQGRERLQVWRGSTHFNEFQRVSKLLESRARQLQFNRYQVHQLKSRVSFWSTFRGNFQGVQFLFPRRTIQLLSGAGAHLSKAQPFDGDVEVCLFDFGRYVVVEVLRSPGNEPPNSPFNGGETRLVDKRVIDHWRASRGGLHSLRQRRAQLVHDHKIRWQQGLYVALRDFGIEPPPGEKYTNFATRDGKQSEFSVQSRVSSKHMKQRRDAFRDWVRSSFPEVPISAYPSYAR